MNVLFLITSFLLVPIYTTEEKTITITHTLGRWDSTGGGRLILLFVGIPGPLVDVNTGKLLSVSVSNESKDSHTFLFGCYESSEWTVNVRWWIENKTTTKQNGRCRDRFLIPHDLLRLRYTFLYSYGTNTLRFILSQDFCYLVPSVLRPKSSFKCKVKTTVSSRKGRSKRRSIHKSSQILCGW